MVDGPSGVGKSTVTTLLAQRFCAAGHDVLATSEPSAGPIGELARGGTHDYQGLTLACLVAADRYHHLAAEVRPALAAGRVVVSDRYVPSSLVLQHLDGVPDPFIWHLNALADKPDLTVLLVGDHEVCRRRAQQRGTYSRFHESLDGEVDAYRRIAASLREQGYRTHVHDIGDESAERVADALFAMVIQELSC
ncbi:dTMP kinase [Actinoplanes sp. NPDC026619]|uniref:dTMP kinase n=1 Tax=Actinoplanes sp. NPDC026619 TaxID=3155798 RepID=UPI0033FF45D8